MSYYLYACVVVCGAGSSHDMKRKPEAMQDMFRFKSNIIIDNRFDLLGVQES